MNSLDEKNEIVVELEENKKQHWLFLNIGTIDYIFYSFFIILIIAITYIVGWKIL